MEARVESVGTAGTRVLRAPTAARRGATELSTALSRALSQHRVALWEWTLATCCVLLLSRGSILFVRIRLLGLFRGGPGALWQDDLVVTATYAVVVTAVIAVAVRRVDTSAILRQPILLAFCAFGWLSTAWSVEPAKTLRHGLLFVATAAVGWYVGTRYSPRELVSVVATAAVVAAAASAVVVLAWPEVGTRSGRNEGWWSGAFVNRNFLGLALSSGLLALLFLLVGSRFRFLVVAAIAPMVGLLIGTGSRTGPVALIAACVVTVAVSMLRRVGRGKLTAAGGATVVFATLGGAGALVHVFWADILAWLGRDTTLTGRTGIWQVVRFFSRLHPWEGWGFEAIWANPRVAAQAQGTRIALRHSATGTPGGWPYSAHNGYLDILLSVGRIGLAVFSLFLAVSAWRAFRYAWTRRDVWSLWPLALIVFAVVVNFSESMFMSGEAIWALTVAAAFAATEASRDSLEDDRDQGSTATAADGGERYPGPS